MFEYQGDIETFVVFLREFLFVFLGLLAIAFAESTAILLGRLYDSSRTVGGISTWIRRDVRPDTTHQLAVHPTLHTLRSVILLHDLDRDRGSETGCRQ
ncbi:hypothetical protein BDM02DRAFT_2006617 [Thelephora ganbajun]|uniref:Uncharacterized protein n=1 Tax=Thelephora ganbajun TaxID=370292 RepID=A0ACB6ZI58_THEGA|nr:hypothetical protein BDM02DRAFT_2006617 [Thelephora ganbajun]